MNQILLFKKFLVVLLVLKMYFNFLIFKIHLPNPINKNLVKKKKV